ncbi:putative peptidyl-tRNA hydrolase PTRHD1 [Lolium rigidum]|uniref:putative peptidyl-tRNA hydrolase PTRHD1 n=1 Tax=Lolium rigidum TaxID=89674 RepID=UPI001F5CBBF0|nr:putative peptidyl-tRNA hydrolase PTRHD1 [Lolium rigidum]XP_047070472.1 putative peptidyl-tRNA hydrolase PTRHD1 [Lolium rigidum]
MLSLLPLGLPSPIASTLPSAASLLPGLARIPILRVPPRASMSAAAASTPEAATSPSPAVGEEARKEAEDVVVQYVVLRRDLADAWPMGSVVAQGCHASVAAVWAHRDHPDTAAYCAPDNLDRMHKVTLEVKGETQLKNLAEKLEAAGVRHKLWIEQPENIPTCIATAPCPKSQVASFFRKLKLCK